MKNAINWFEIPVKNFDKAKNFYETIFGADIANDGSNGNEIGFLSGRICKLAVLVDVSFRVKDMNRHQKVP